MPPLHDFCTRLDLLAQAMPMFLEEIDWMQQHQAHLKLLARNPNHGHYWHDLAKLLAVLRSKIDRLEAAGLIAPPELSPSDRLFGAGAQYRTPSPDVLALTGWYHGGEFLAREPCEAWALLEPRLEREKLGQSKPAAPQADPGGPGGEGAGG